MSAFFTGSLPGSLVTMPLSVARAGVEDCAADDGELCAESAAAATTSHNRAAGKTFIVFECGREIPEFARVPTVRIDQVTPTRYSNPIKQPLKNKVASSTLRAGCHFITEYPPPPTPQISGIIELA